MEFKLISEYWQILVAFVAVVVWLLRLEAKVISSGKDIFKLEVEHEKDIVKLEQAHEKSVESVWQKLESIQTTLNQLLVSVGELKGRLEKEK